MGQPILLVAGARPNFMKLAPVQRALSSRIEDVMVVHTGQHYDHIMSQVFFDELGIPEPDVHLGVGSGSHAFQTAKIMIEFEKLCNDLSPKMVVVFGDVNSTVACSLVAAKLLLPVAHVEAGLRSGDNSMPEEVNRIVTDHLSSILFTTTSYANENLLAEGIDDDRIFLVGNVMIDTLIHQTKLINESTIISELDLVPGEYNLLTLHRPVNVDFRENLETIFSKIAEIGYDKKWIFPAHPRTLSKIRDFKLESSLGFLSAIQPLGYNDFSKLVKNANSVWTDSGGIQEECTFYKIPCLTIRENTERPETILHGTNRLVSLDDDFSKIYENIPSYISSEDIPHWDGDSSERISKIISDFLG